MIRTRFAPSPTGYLHIGGVRTALFNWLFARHHGGKFVLRIDDTDQQRNVQQALQPILNGFRWLGINWDEGPEVDGPYGPYFQSQRSDRYQHAVNQLLDKDVAYRDYATPEEIQAEREAAAKEKRPFVYSRSWMAETPALRQKFESQGRQPVVRLKIPNEGTLTINDEVRGEVNFEWAREQDHVIQRADGSFLYHLATVIDDHDFRITHVIRAEEHLSNTPRQIFIAQALGFDLPRYAHIPYVAEPGSKTKLSKRKLDKYLKHPDFAGLSQRGQSIARRMNVSTSAETFNPVIIDFYEKVGFLPDAIVNYLLLLGWSLDDRTEYFTRQEMIDHFSLERVNKSPASFDPQKLMAFQDHYFRQLPTKQKVAKVLPFLQKAGHVETPPACDTGPRLARVVEAAGDRLRVSGDILDYDDFYATADELKYDEKTFAKRLRNAPESVELLRQFRKQLSESTQFDASSLETSLKSFVAEKGVRISEIIHTLRVAVTGKSVGFGMFETLELLGRDECLLRIDRSLHRLTSVRLP